MIELEQDIIVAIVTGILTGILVGRLAHFEQLRAEARRILHDIDFGSINNGPVQFRAHDRPSKLTNVASDFLAAGHREAGLAMLRLHGKVADTLYLKPGPDIEEMGDRYSQWQDVCRDIRPSLTGLCRIHGGLDLNIHWLIQLAACLGLMRWLLG